MDVRFLCPIHANIFFFPLQDKIFCLTLQRFLKNHRQDRLHLSIKQVFCIRFALSLHPQTRNDGVIAQLVEQRTENPCVPGSIPGDTTNEKPITIVIGFCFLLFISIISVILQ